MGNTDSSLVMMAVSRKVFLKKVHILLLRYAMKSFSDDFGMIDREGFDRARAKAQLTKVEILDLLFTMWDTSSSEQGKNSGGKVSCKEFCTGLSPLACPSGGLPTILEFALRVVSNDQGRKTTEWKDLHELLTGINSTASYFGDAHLLPDEIDTIVDMVFEESDRISHEACRERLLTNAYVKRFASGKARACVHFKENLETNFIFDKDELVTEYIVDDIDALVFNDENENVSATRRDSSLGRDGSKETSGERGSSSSSYDAPRLSPEKKKSAVALGTAAFDKRDSRDEIARLHHHGGNDAAAMTTAEENSSGRRDPPPAVNRAAPKRIEISYSTYRRSMTDAASPRMSRDPSPRLSSVPPTIFR